MSEDEYIAFVDESGDAVLDPIDPQFPVLVLAFCLFRRSEYNTMVRRQLHELKVAHFGTDNVVFHEREIRQRRGAFTSLGSEANRLAFMSELTQTLEQLPFTVIAVAADKSSVGARSGTHVDLYQQCVRAGLERSYQCLSGVTKQPFSLKVMVESRGRSEDRKLRAEFESFQNPASTNPTGTGVDLSFATKKEGQVGLEVADLIAYPIARHVIGRPQQNDPFQLIQRKMYHGPDGEIDDYGLTIIGR